MMKVIKTTDGRFAIVERTQVNRSIAIWSPVDERRWDDESSAEHALFLMKIGMKEPPVIKQKPEVSIDRSHLPFREDLRIVKLDKRVFVIERRRFGKYEVVKTCKTRTKAEDWCACNSRTY